MAEVKILLKGYTTEESEEESSCSTITLVKDKGIIWKENFPEDDLYASDKEELEKSRKKVLEVADYVIPGHGDMFKVKK